MQKNALLVGCSYTGSPIPDTKIDVLGLCRPRIDASRAAYALYEYDVIVINPASYSHFLFGASSEHSASQNELWDLKAENNNYDLDSAYDFRDRSKELAAAIAQGSRVIWLLAPEKHTKFFGSRSVYIGYASDIASTLINSGTLEEKKSRRLTLKPEADEFKPYYEQLKVDGWKFCLSDFNDSLESFAESPEGYSLGGRVKVGSSFAWMLTPPTSQEATNLLIACALGLGASDGLYAVPCGTRHFHLASAATKG